jgi:hypothetical protein
MFKLFVDTDVCIDLQAVLLFDQAAAGKIKIYVSALSFANIDYLLRSQYSAPNSRKILLKFKTLVTILPVDSKVIDLSLASDFNDFEDAIQHYTAVNAALKLIITRNTKDFRKSLIPVQTPESYLSNF